MIAMEIGFDAGAMHAQPWATTATADDIEWPPHPARLLRALLHPWLTGCERVADLDAAMVEAVLRTFATPPTFVLPRAMSGRTHHTKPFSLERGATPVDSVLGVERASRVEAFAIWPDACPTEAIAETAKRLAAGVSSIGGSAPASLRLCVDPGDRVAASHFASRPIEGREPDGMAAIERRVALVGAGELAKRLAAARMAGDGAPLWSHGIVRYGLPLDDVLVSEQADDEDAVFDPFILRFALEGALPPRRAVIAVAEAMRGAALATYSRLHGRPASHRLAGKSPVGSKRAGHDHPYFLPRATDDRIDFVDVFLPSGSTHREYRALVTMASIYDSAMLRQQIGVRCLGRTEPESGTRWRTVTPVVLERFPKQRRSDGAYLRDAPDEQLRGAFARRDLHCGALAWEAARAVDLRRSGKTQTPPAVDVEVDFGQRISGPLVLGSLAHFGIGRFEPVS